MSAGATENATGVPTSSARAVWRDALVALLAVAGLFDALYLTLQHLSGRSVRCAVVTGCDEVLSSAYATVGGSVPLAALGLAAYFVVFSLAVLAAFGHQWARRPMAAVVALMLAFTLWLLYVQAFVLNAFCTYCLISAGVTALLALLTFGYLLPASKPRLD